MNAHFTGLRTDTGKALPSFNQTTRPSSYSGSKTMIPKPSHGLLIASFAALTTTSLLAQGVNTNDLQFATPGGHIVNIGGPRVAGHFRPPLWANVGAAPGTGYGPSQIRTAYGFDKLN